MTKAKQVVVKVQQSIVTSETKRQVLVYNQDRSIMWQGDITPDLRKVLGDDLKSYWYATVMKDGNLRLERRTGWRTW
jgi:hypothetical protein